MLGNTDNPEAEILAKSATREGKKSCYIKTGTGIQERPFFRHELASALWYLAQKNSDPLIAYLIAAHHGKVRMSIRSNPHETPPDSNIRYTCGIAEGDILPSVEIAPDLKPPERVKIRRSHFYWSDMGIERGGEVVFGVGRNLRHLQRLLI